MKLLVENLSYKYENGLDEVLKSINLSIEKGEWVSILGHNGSGKSTLAKLLIGINLPTSGRILIDNLELKEENLYEIRKHIGIVYQDPDNQFVATSIEDDVAFGLENLCIPQEEMKPIIDRCLKTVNMYEYRDSMPNDLSGGQKQRAAIAGILAINPDILIFDEATSMLDPKGREDFIKVIRELKNNGKTIIMITHNMDEALLSDRCIILNNGEIIKNGKTLDVFMDEKYLKKSKLEMPSELYIYHQLKNNNYKNKEVLNLLWELASKK